MRIAHLIDSLGYGGAEQVLADLSAAQARAGHEVIVICLRDRGRNPVDLAPLFAAGGRLVELHKPDGFHLPTLMRLARTLRKCRIEVLHAHNHLVYHYGALAGRMARVVAIMDTLHGSASLLSSAWWSRALFRLSGRLGHRVVSVCGQVDRVLRETLHFPPARLGVVDNGIDTERFAAQLPRPAGGTLTFGAVGRLEPVKDYRNLLHAFANLRQRGVRARLRILGDGTLLPELRALAGELGVSGDVDFAGFSPDVSGFLQGVDVLVISSLSEGLPLVLLQAMAVGLPVVATAVGEIPYILAAARCGWLCPPQAPAELAEAMLLAVNAGDLKETGARGRRYAQEKYSLARMARDYEGLYRELCSAGAARPTAAGHMQAAARRIGKRTLIACGAFRIAERLASAHLVVLTYHRVVPRGTAGIGNGRAVNTLFADEFEAQMAHLARRYTLLGGNELRAVLLEGATPPRYSAAITFDDGYENNFTCALPILQRLGIPAAFFVTTNLIGAQNRLFWFDRLDRVLGAASAGQVASWLRAAHPGLMEVSGDSIRSQFKRLSSELQESLLEGLESRVSLAPPSADERLLCAAMNWDQVRSLTSAGMTVGSHTMNHQILSAVPPQAARVEVQLSLERIERETGRPCWLFAYPNGGPEDFRPEDEFTLEQAGYRCAFTQIPGVVRPETPRFRLPRVPVSDSGDVPTLRMGLSGLRPRFAASRR
jgi:glycosyltransferase involved in cell wall biosynthesis/peptidoglycan/xylan/chitin deacetylase (PgdA/CDA1 family)